MVKIKDDLMLMLNSQSSKFRVKPAEDRQSISRSVPYHNLIWLHGSFNSIEFNDQIFKDIIHDIILFNNFLFA